MIIIRFRNILLRKNSSNQKRWNGYPAFCWFNPKFSILQVKLKENLRNPNHSIMAQISHWSQFLQSPLNIPSLYVNFDGCNYRYCHHCEYSESFFCMNNFQFLNISFSNLILLLFLYFLDRSVASNSAFRKQSYGSLSEPKLLNFLSTSMALYIPPKIIY